MLRVDTHTHILPKHIPDLKEEFGYGGFIQLDHYCDTAANMVIDGKVFRKVDQNVWDPGTRIEECDDKDVGVQVLSTVPVMFSYWAEPRDTLRVAQLVNDHIAGVVEEFPARFVGLGTLPMQDTALAIKELERCVKQLGLPGVEIGTHVNGSNLNDPRFIEFYAAAVELDASVFVHPWDMLAEERMRQYWHRWLIGMPAETALAISSMIFGGIFERFPKLRVLFAHGGGSFPGTIGRIEHGFNVRPDLCAVDNNVNPREYLGSFWLDSLVHDRHMLRYLVDLVGEDYVAMGSDYPFVLGEHEPGALVAAMDDFPPPVKEKLLALNAFAWLNLDPQLYMPHGTVHSHSGHSVPR
jgi:aminocarboxymuconate-semialdehyde decarboxylase